MMKNILLTISFHLCILGVVFGQSSNYSIRLIDATSSEILIGANIQSSNAVFVTDIYGISEFSTNSNIIKISYVGYESKDYLLLDQREIQTVKLKPSTALLEMATISSSRYKVALGEATVSLEVLSPRLIDNNNIVAMDGLLDMVPGVQMVGDQVNIRGGSGFSYGSGSRVMLLIDDIQALTMDSGFPNWADVPLENISQVEVLKGAASSLYGSAALNGIVNIRTGMPSTEPETKVSIAYTSFMSPKEAQMKWWDKSPNSTYINFLDKRKFGKFDLVLNGNYYNINSFNKDTKSVRGRFGFKTRYRLSDKLSFSINGMYNAADTKDFFLWKDNIETFVGLEGASSARIINRWQLDPGIQYFSKNGFNHYWKNRFSSIKNVNDNDQSVNAISYYTEYQLQKEITKLGIKTISGVTYSTVRSESDLYGGNVYRYSNFSVFLQLDKKLFDRLNLSLGTRLESNQLSTLEGEKSDPLSGTELVSRAGLNYKLFKANYLRASWGQGYRFPTIAERYIRTQISGLVLFPNDELRPEKGWTSEIGIKSGFKLGTWKGYVDVAGFYQSYEDMMEFVFVVDGIDVGFQSQNIGFTNIFGYELSIGSSSKIGNIPVNILSGYTYINPKYDIFKPSTKQSSSVDYNVLKYRSKHNVKLDIEAIFNKLDAGISLQTTSPILAIDERLASFAEIKAYRSKYNVTRHLLNLRIGYTWNKLKVGLLLNNTLNQAYTTRPGLMEAPRNMVLKLSYKF